MNKYELVIFDMDGTILDTLDDLHESMVYALTTCGYEPITREQARAYVGNGIRKYTERALPEGTSEAEIVKVFETMMPYYKAHSADKTRPYPGINELLVKLRQAGIKTAVVSNKADAAVKVLAEKYFPGLFDMAVGEKPPMARKPAPDEVNYVLSEMGYERSQAVYVGDSNVDVETARNSEMDLIAVDWGFRDRDVLESMGVDTIVSKAEEIYDLVAPGNDLG